MSCLPLESNPEVMNKFLYLLGVPKKWKIVDVYGLDGDALAWIPRPVLALILLFPCSEKSSKYAEEQASKLKETGQLISPDLFYMKQYVSNTCGTVALIHSIANNVERIGLQDGPFKKIIDDAKSLTPEQRGEILVKSKDNDALNLITAHQELAMEGQTRANPNEKVDHHFVAIIEKDGHLYELDGSKDSPINHGPTSSDSFLEDAAKVCSEFIARDAEDVNFTVMALSASDD